MPISTVVGTNTVTTKDWLRVMEGVTFHSGEAPFPLPIVSAQRQLQQVDELIGKLELAAAVEPRPSVLANIRALEKERRILISS